MTTRHEPDRAVVRSVTWRSAVAALRATRAPAARRRPTRASGYVEATEVRVAAEVGGRLLEVEGRRRRSRRRRRRRRAPRHRGHRAGAPARRGRSRAGRRRSWRCCAPASRPEDIRQAAAQVAVGAGRRAGRAGGARRRGRGPRALREAAARQRRLGQAARRCGDAARRGARRACAARRSARRPRPRRSRAAARRRAPQEIDAARARVAAVDAQIAALAEERRPTRSSRRRSAASSPRKLLDAGEMAAPRAPIVGHHRSRSCVGQRLCRRAAGAAAEDRPGGDARHRRRAAAARDDHLHLAEGGVHAAQRADRRGAFEARLPHQGHGRQQGRRAQARHAGRSGDPPATAAERRCRRSASTASRSATAP